jgi:hypothetical protein
MAHGGFSTSASIAVSGARINTTFQDASPAYKTGEKPAL